MKRRDFLVRASTLPLVAGLVNFIAACGSGGGGNSYSSPSPTPTPGPAPSGGALNCNTNGGQSAVGAASGHVHPSTNVPAADMLTATQKTYLVPDGGIGHTHTFTVAASQFTALQGNTSISLATDADGTGHSHSVTVNCI